MFTKHTEGPLSKQNNRNAFPATMRPNLDRKKKVSNLREGESWLDTSADAYISHHAGVPGTPCY